MAINDTPGKHNTNAPMKKSKLQYVTKNKAVILIGIATLAVLASFLLRFIEVQFFLDFPLDFEWVVKSKMNDGLDWLVINGAWFFDTTSYFL